MGQVGIKAMMFTGLQFATRCGVCPQASRGRALQNVQAAFLVFAGKKDKHKAHVSQVTRQPEFGVVKFCAHWISFGSIPELSTCTGIMALPN